MINTVLISRSALKDLEKVPRHIFVKLNAWKELVETEGLHEARKIPGFHDEPLKGKRMGQRSIRLSKAYRAIYILRKNDQIQFVSIEEVNKHEY